jgi:hypothetical protein
MIIVTTLMRNSLDRNADTHYLNDTYSERSMVMTNEATVKEFPEISEAADPGSTGKRERSTIGFPYLDLDDSIEIAKGVHDLTGANCQWDQLAAKLDQSATGGAFRQRVMTAKMFGFVTYSQGTITLTPLGSRLCDPQQEASAKSEAFLNVPLYKAVYEQFRSVTLPPVSALENAMVSMGVAQKQKDKARQVFQRSATQAGFFALGPNRLVLPAIRNSAAAPAVTPIEEPEKTEKKKPKDADEDDEEMHPFIKGLLRKLPPPDSEWPNDKRAKWLQAAINIFDLMYTESEDDSKRTITIGFQKDSARQ